MFQISLASAVKSDSVPIFRHSGIFREEYWGRMKMLFAGGFSFANFLVDVLTVFVFVIWFWLAISVFGDLFRRNDMSGWGKALWVIGVLLLPYFGVLV